MRVHERTFAVGDDVAGFVLTIAKTDRECAYCGNTVPGNGRNEYWAKTIKRRAWDMCCLCFALIGPAGPQP